MKAHLAAGELCPPHVIVPLLRLKIAGVERGIESDDPLLVEHITKAINPQAEEKLEPKPPPTAKTYVYGQFQGGYDDAEKTEVLKVQWIQKPMRAILLDGFPREGAQGLEFEKEIGAPVAVLHVRCVKDEAKKRYLGRGREKDDERLFEQRYAEYVQKSHVVLERYKKIVVEVDTNAEMEVSYERLVKMLGEAEKTGWIVQR